MNDFFKKKNAVVDVNVKRPGDERTFRAITLDNKLAVLLISDPHLNKSAAAMDVGVGSLADPKDHVGLAHFLEHMLFLGTQKYPNVEEYSEYLAKYQGESNAYTDEEDTNYYFAVNHDGFEGALDRFSQFFIQPLFNPEFVERELHAVDSEHQKNLKNDAWRVRRVFQDLHKAGHPRQKFGTGNIDTLKSVDKETLVSFYKQHYSANIMKLAMMSPVSLDEMETLARQKFAAVPNYDRKKPEYDQEIFTKDQLPRLVKIQSIKNIHRMELSFASKSEKNFWKSKPAAAISYLIGYEGTGSLLSLLKKEGLVSKLEAGAESTSYTGTFHFDFELTDKGVKNWKDIVEHFFAYIELLKKEGYKKYLFDERKTMTDIDYYYREPREGGHVVSEYAMKMHIYDPMKIDFNDLLLHDYNTKEFDEFLSYLQPEKLNILFVSNDVQGDTTEKYYGVNYKVEKLDPDFVKNLQGAAVDSRLYLPKPNTYIPEKLEMVTDSSASKPTKLIDNEWGTFWFQLDDIFKIPRASIRLVLLNLKTNDTPYGKMMAQLYSESLFESLNEWAYTVSLAGLHLEVSQSERGIQIDVSGYAEKIPQLLAELSEKMTDITITAEAFEDVKTDLKRKISNTVLNSAYWQTLYELKYASNRNMIHNFEFFDPVKKNGVDLISPVKFSDIQAYAKSLYNEIAIEGAAYGSLHADKLKASIERFTTVYGSQKLAASKRPKEEVLIYPTGRDLAIVRHSLTNNNSWGMNVQFGPRDLKLNAALRIGHAHLQTSFYTDLRTRQQLGYIVASNLSIQEHVLGLLFLVQSANYTPFDIAQRASKWMQGAVEELTVLKTEEFETYKQGVIKELREKDKTIQEKLESLYFEGVLMKGHFNYKEDVALAASSITKEEMVEVFRRALLGPKKASLSVYFTVQEKPEEKPMGSLVMDVKTLKSETPIYQ
jgi:insulysin